MANNSDLMQKIVSLSKRRGFVYPSSEIYGGFAATYDYGPMGALLTKNIKDLWWKHFITDQEDMLAMDGAIFCHPRTWEASGHVASFDDPLVEDKKTHLRYRADKLLEQALGINVGQLTFEEIDELIKKNHIKSPDGNELTEVKHFNLLVEAKLGSTEETKEIAYLRGETCQIIFVQFLNLLNQMGGKVPFGVGQMGKAFRNEITVKQFILRTREFQQMETEYFVKPGEDMGKYEYWKALLQSYFVDKLGFKPERFRFREIEGKEKSHYAKKQFDFEIETLTSDWVELSPLNHRGDYDLSRHSEFSGKSMSVFDLETKQRFVPYVIETSIGLDRTLYMVLETAYSEEDNRVVLKLPVQLAPYKAAIFPLVKNKEELVSKARSVYSMLKLQWPVMWDDRGNIGKRYFAQDEIGTPFCITIDYDTLNDDTVTVRDRDTMKQERVSISNLIDFIQGKIKTNFQ